MSQDTQFVYQITENGGIDSVRRYKRSIPQPGPNEVLVKIKAVSLNYRDIAMLTGKYPVKIKENAIPTSDGCADVVSTGSNVSQFSKGDRVLINCAPNHFYGMGDGAREGLGGPADGVLAQYCVFPATAIVRAPRNLTPEEACTLPCAGVTAWNSLYGMHGQQLRPGQTVLLLGTGGVSMMGLMIAVAGGAKVIVTSSSDEKLAKVMEMGAAHTINYRTTPNWEDAVLQYTNGQGVDFILENGGVTTIEKSLACIKPGGMIALIGFLGGTKDDNKMPDLVQLALTQGAILRAIWIGGKELHEHLVTAVEARNLKPTVDKVFGFEESEVQAAYKYLESGGFIGKIVIRVD